MCVQRLPESALYSVGAQPSLSKLNKSSTLVSNDVERLGQEFGHLLGGDTVARLDLTHHRTGAGHTLREVFLGKPEVLTTLPEPQPKRCSSIHAALPPMQPVGRSEEHTSELQSPCNLV